MTIDSHQHFWRYDPQRDAWITEEMSALRRDFLPDELMTELRLSGIDGCVAVQADQSEHETMFLLNLASRYDVIKGVVGWVNLSSPQICERLEHFSRFEKLCGFRHIAQSEPDDRFLLRDDFCRGVRCLSSFNFTYDILIYPKQLSAAIELAERCPDQHFVLDHIAKPSIRTGAMNPWARDIRTLAQNPNICCKLSGLITEADWRNWRETDFWPYLDVVFDSFGTDRLMFGSDWPVCLLAGTYRQVKELVARYFCNLPAEQQEKIFGLNAISFYRLKVSHHEPATAK
jgi:L-fucono-1,5-lactonase